MHFIRIGSHLPYVRTSTSRSSPSTSYVSSRGARFSLCSGADMEPTMSREPLRTRSASGRELRTQSEVSGRSDRSEQRKTGQTNAVRVGCSAPVATLEALPRRFSRNVDRRRRDDDVAVVATTALAVVVVAIHALVSSSTTGRPSDRSSKTSSGGDGNNALIAPTVCALFRRCCVGLDCVTSRWSSPISRTPSRKTESSFRPGDCCC